jgi:hypothetical protein
MVLLLLRLVLPTAGYLRHPVLLAAAAAMQCNLQVPRVEFSNRKMVKAAYTPVF